ncbi:MAG: SGNH/GDSL hydrolase family protein [Terriglobia bacterium]
MVTEEIEWTWAERPPTTDLRLPNVLLLGDSITRAYYPDVARELRGRANCYLFATSASSGDPRLALQLQSYFNMVRVSFSIIHFNNGMHGWGYSEAQYADGLPELVAELRKNAPGAKLIWANTTPVRKDSKSGGASNARVEARNALAAKLMRADHIPTDDQYTLMAAHADLHSDDVHYTGAGCALQAKQVVRLIAPSLPQPR